MDDGHVPGTLASKCQDRVALVSNRVSSNDVRQCQGKPSRSIPLPQPLCTQQMRIRNTWSPHHSSIIPFEDDLLGPQPQV
eukprot:scaffold38269_cov33-Tisochrysis_lutea.AAC.1